MRTTILLALLLLAATPAAAQQVQGVVVDPGGQAVSGAYVSLRDDAGLVVSRSLTGVDGRFTVRGGAAGTYRVRVERIGYASTTSAAMTLAAGESRDLRLVAGGAPVALAGLVVQGRSRCDVRPQEGRAAAQLWNEARKALDATTWTAGAMRFGYTEYERDVDPRTGRVRTQASQGRTAMGRRAWRTRDTAELSRSGFREQAPDGIYYYAPDADLLLSEAFQDGHCFGVQEGTGPEQGLVGLTFRPVRRRSYTDVRGVLWIDPATAELRHLDFRFTGLPAAEDYDAVGGRVEFARLAGGSWIVRRWRLRMPLLVERRAVGLPGAFTVQLDGLRETGGYVQDVTSQGGERLFASEVGTLEGTVVDAGTEAPLRGARVSLVGTDRAVTADSVGRFRLTGLDEGRYSVTFKHPRTDSLGITVPPTDVSVRLGGATAVRLVAPSLANALAAGCDTVRAGQGVLTGTVRNSADGAALPAAQVSASWPGASGPVRAEVTADDAGRYRLCGVPPGVKLSARAAYQGRTGEVAEITLLNTQPVLRDLSTTVLAAGGQPDTTATAASMEARLVDAATNTPIAGARVRFGDDVEGRTTNDRGAITVRRVPQGTYRVEIEHADYGHQTRWVAIAGGGTMSLTIKLPRPAR